MSARESELSVTVGDCVEVMAAMPAASVDAIVTDPPYGINFMGKEWDGRAIAAAAINGLDHTTPRERSGSMHAGNNDYSRNAEFGRWCELWAREALRILKPGGHLLACGGTRTYHRLACAIEDAGFEIRDTIAWLYGSGFPKSLNAGKAMDTLRWRHPGDFRLREAAAWAGHGSALKPAHEPIVVARKPLTGTVAANVLAHGTGALNVDGCRIGTEHITAHGGGQNEQRTYGMGKGIPAIEAGANPHVGRWPANVCLDEQAASLLDTQTDARPGSHAQHHDTKSPTSVGGGLGCVLGQENGYGDSGGASRFLYVAKASSAERNAGLDGFEAKPLRPDGASFGEMTMWNGQNGDERWRAKNPNHPRANVHPTVKPIALMRWLVRLVAPPGGTVLDPFAGSGTTGIAAALEGLRFIGIEREAEYVAIAQARIAWWARHPDGMTLVKRLEAETEQTATVAAGQGSLFDVPDAPSTSSNGRDGEASADARYTDRGASNFAMKPGRRR